MAQIATAWCLAKDSVTAPIVGTTKLENLTEIIGVYAFVRRAGKGALTLLAGALDIKLSEDDIKYLEEPYKPTAVFGHW